MSSEPMDDKSVSSPASGHDGRKLILSVDDQLGVLYSRYKLLSAAGCAVLSATDGVQALQIFGGNKVDLVLLDFMLQGMDGGLVADAMKAHSPNVPILMVSGVEVPEDCLSKVNGFVRKAEGADSLLKSIRELAAAKPMRLVPRLAAS
ncbi:MAG TPA: response regulator [Terriglobales bacterium]